MQTGKGFSLARVKQGGQIFLCYKLVVDRINFNGSSVLIHCASAATSLGDDPPHRVVSTNPYLCKTTKITNVAGLNNSTSNSFHLFKKSIAIFT